MSVENPNLEGEQPQDANNANPEVNNQETANQTRENQDHEGEQDPTKKAAESFKEAMRLRTENEKLQKERDEAVKAADDLRNAGTRDKTFDDAGEGQPTEEELVPGFSDLAPEQQESIQRLSDGIAKRTRDQIYKDPAISFAVRNFNEKKFDDAFRDLTEAFPELKEDAKAKEFKQKYFNPTNVPSNIASILPDVAKIYLFDNAKNIGAQEERERSNRTDTERQTSGEKTGENKRSLEEWQQLQQRDPAKFASLSKEFNTAMRDGSI